MTERGGRGVVVDPYDQPDRQISVFYDFPDQLQH